MNLLRFASNVWRSPARALCALALASAVLLAGAWWFELAMQLIPCKLCLEQREPHYAALAVALAGLASLRYGAGKAAAGALAVLAGLYLWSTGLGVYHSGVEWGWFMGPNDCGGRITPSTGGAGDLMKQLESVRVVSCTQAAWRFLGLSLAGWNAIFSLVSAGVAALALLAARKI
ncbi:MAG: disulfide bond formation protein B [Bosea sp. (in: a-proteobacteria)]